MQRGEREGGLGAALGREVERRGAVRQPRLHVRAGADEEPRDLPSPDFKAFATEDSID